MRASQSLKRFLLVSPKYGYMTPVDKPIYSLSLTSLHQLSAEMMQYLTIQSQFCPEISVIGGSIAFRICIELVGITIRKFKYENNRLNKISQIDVIDSRTQKQDRLLLRIIDKVFVVDMIRDLQFYGVVKSDINKAAYQYFRPSALISNIVITYLNLNFLRGAHYLITSSQFQEFCSNTVYLQNLVIHDPKFITPVVIIFINFYLFKRSRHPFLIHFNHPANLFQCFNLAFVSGLIFVPIPSVYHLSYIGLALGHIMLRGCRYYGSDLFREISKIRKKIIQ